MAYRIKKGLGTSHPEKSNRQKFLTLEDFRSILKAVEDEANENWKRDHCAIFLSFYFALRVKECSMLERACFRHINDEVVYIRTLKRLKRIPWNCKQCGRRLRVSPNKIGKEHSCPRCGSSHRVSSNSKVQTEPPEVALQSIERPVLNYVRTYMKEEMRSDQKWLFESFEGQAITPRMLRYIFGHYSMAAGLDPVISFHSLRHGRGTQVYEKFEDPKSVQEALRQAGTQASEFYMHMSPKRLKQRRRSLEEDFK